MIPAEIAWWKFGLVRNQPLVGKRIEEKGGTEMTVGAWIMLFLYVVGLGGGSIALILYSMKHNTES